VAKIWKPPGFRLQESRVESKHEDSRSPKGEITPVVGSRVTIVKDITHQRLGTGRMRVKTLPDSRKEESQKDLDHPFVEDAWQRSRSYRCFGHQGNRSEDPARILKGKMSGFDLGH
jgi:hypothetical protein